MPDKLKLVNDKGSKKQRYDKYFVTLVDDGTVKSWDCPYEENSYPTIYFTEYGLNIEERDGYEILIPWPRIKFVERFTSYHE